MLPRTQQVAFLLFACVALVAAGYTWRRLLRRIAAGAADTDQRFNGPVARLWYALVTTLTQRRTFRRRPVVSSFHSFIFYGFVFYLLVNLVDATEGFFPFTIRSTGPAGLVYNTLADLFSWLVLLGVIALTVRRFASPSRQDFTFNERTLLHPAVAAGAIGRDSLLVSAFILVHVGSRALGAGARLAEEGPDRAQPFATLLSHAVPAQDAHLWREFSYWGALGSVLLFLAYFPRSKHIHIAFAPAKYALARDVTSGVLPPLAIELAGDEPKLGACRLEDLAWPRLLDAYACIQCNRCQDACPATATGKALSPSALEINKRMELNELARTSPAFESGQPSPQPLLQFALSPEAAWACTTCGACIEVCPVGDEPMLDIIDVRRQQVLMEGSFPPQLQTAFRGMERFSNPWAISQDKRADWTDGLRVPTIDQNPNPDVLFWVGCAASYDPQAQKTARAFVQLLNHAGVNFAILGKKECCTGDSARRAGNELLYRELADKNVATLNDLNPRLIVATCPHCMNAIGKEYAQLGGNYRVLHHSQYLESLISEGRLAVGAGDSTIAFHDPCYLGRHNGVYDAPRNVLRVLSNSVVELDRSRENSFCCGAGGAQFWKEEEPGNERIAENRLREAEAKLAGAQGATLAVGCPFCKSMLQSSSASGTTPLAVRDLAELLLEGVERTMPTTQSPTHTPQLLALAPDSPADVRRTVLPASDLTAAAPAPAPATEQVVRKKWAPKPKLDVAPELIQTQDAATPLPAADENAASAPRPRRKWAPKTSANAGSPASDEPVTAPITPETPLAAEPSPAPEPRKRWTPKAPPS